MDLVSVNEALKLFHLEVNENYEIINHNDNSKSTLVLNKGNYEYIFVFNGVEHTLIINKDYILISNSEQEYYIFSNAGFSYNKKIRNSHLNSDQVTIQPRLMSFYSRNDLKDGNSYCIGIKANLNGNRFTYGDIKEKMDLVSVQIIDSIIDRNKRGTNIFTTKRIYENERLTQTDATSDFSELSVHDYILNELCNNGFVITLLHRLEALLPGITSYLGNVNGNVLKIKNEEIEKKISNN